MLGFENTKTFFLKNTHKIGQRKFLLLAKLRIQLNGYDLNGETIAGSFCVKELQKTNQNKYRIEKVIKRKGDKLYVKQKGYDNSFNSQIDKKEIV